MSPYLGLIKKFTADGVTTTHRHAHCMMKERRETDELVVKLTE